MMGKILAVGRGYVGKGLAAASDAFEVDLVSHRDIFKTDISKYSVLVNCAGLNGSGLCENTEHSKVWTANVEFPVALRDFCKSQETGLKFVQLSTAGVYVPQRAPFEGFTSRVEGDPVRSYNRYIESKLAMEAALGFGSDCYIFRLGWLDSGAMFQERSRNWTHVVNTFCSVVSCETLLRAFDSIMRQSIPYGIYNIASRDVFFPDYFNQVTGWNLPSTGEVSGKMTSAVPISVGKAEEVGLL